MKKEERKFQFISCCIILTSFIVDMQTCLIHVIPEGCMCPRIRLTLLGQIDVLNKRIFQLKNIK